MIRSHDIMMNALRRLLSGAIVVLFTGTYFAAPVYASFVLCGGTCCSPAAGESQSITADAMAGCKSECSIRQQVAETDVQPAVPGMPDRFAATPAHVAAVSARPAGLLVPARDECAPGCARSAPLNILHSTFRI